MAISTYSELKTAVADFLNRDDLTDIIPTFISLGEAQIMRDSRHWRQQRRATTTLNERFENLPSDFLQGIHFYIDTTNGRKTLEFASSAEISRRNLNAFDVPGEPEVYTINSGQIEFIPAPDGDYPLTLIYYAKTQGLSDDNPENWLLTYYPDVYLYASLMHTAPYLQEDQRFGIWGQLYAAGVLKANQESDAALYSGPLVLRNK